MAYPKMRGKGTMLSFRGWSKGCCIGVVGAGRTVYLVEEEGAHMRREKGERKGAREELV